MGGATERTGTTYFQDTAVVSTEVGRSGSGEGMRKEPERKVRCLILGRMQLILKVLTGLGMWM